MAHFLHVEPHAGGPVDGLLRSEQEGWAGADRPTDHDEPTVRAEGNSEKKETTDL